MNKVKLPILTEVRVIDHVATGDAFRKLREARGLSIYYVAKKLGYSAPYISDLERGRRNWSPALVEGFTNALS